MTWIFYDRSWEKAFYRREKAIIVSTQAKDMESRDIMDCIWICGSITSVTFYFRNCFSSQQNRIATELPTPQPAFCTH